MTRVLPVRHGSHGLLGKVLVGRTPGVPSMEGRLQADDLAGFFAGVEGVDTVLTSPLQRCRETAAPIAARLGVAIETREELNELDCGAWTGKSFEELADDPRWQAWNQHRATVGIPDGESVEDVRQRVKPLVERAGATGRPAAIWVTHSEVIKIVVMPLLGVSPDRHDKLEIGPASVTTLDLWPGGGKLVRSNQELAA